MDNVTKLKEAIASAGIENINYGYHRKGFYAATTNKQDGETIKSLAILLGIQVDSVEMFSHMVLFFKW